MGRHGQIRADVVKGLTSSSWAAFSRITRRYSWYLRTRAGISRRSCCHACQPSASAWFYLYLNPSASDTIQR